MHGTHLLTHIAVAEKTRNVLSACRQTLTSGDYARRLVDTIAEVTQSLYAVWLNWPAGPDSLVAETQEVSLRSRVLSLCACIPRLSNDRDADDGVRSIIAAPVMFRSTLQGILAVANSARPYTAADLEFLTEVGRTALLDYENLARAEALGLASPRQKIADLVHGLRQPLGILEACAVYIDLVLPAGEARAREQLAEIQRQLDRASGILDKSAQLYQPYNCDPGFEDAEPGEESRILTKSAMSMVT
jgi:GAF domain-containing protein